jgi:XTP/dITP diphosphohydrolase
VKPPVVLLATRSVGKLKELKPMFEAAGLRAVDLTEFGLDEELEVEQAIEVYDSFAENAVAKARYFYEVSGGVATVADDSGLVVEALGGAPGVRSHRWSGEGSDSANNAKLVASMAGQTDRRARFECAAAFVGLGTELVASGVVGGEIVDQPRGSGGFGYDAYFESSELRKTFGEATLEEKARVSHRARAFHALLVAIASAPAR